jgi:hypothetical protein
MEPRADLCPYDADPGAVTDYLARRLPAAAEQDFERHLFSCSRCWEEVQLAVAVRASAQAARRSWRAPLAAAAALTALALGAAALWRAPRSELPVMRGKTTGLTVTVRAEGALRHLAWPEVNGASSYRIELFDAAGAALEPIETAASTITLDLTQRSRAASVRVSARDELRETILASPSLPLR